MRKAIYGVTVKSDSYYVIRDKEDHTFSDGVGGFEYNVHNAYWFDTYREAKAELSTFDEPQEWEIIRMNCTTTLEEIMDE